MITESLITITTKDIPDFINEAGVHRIQRVPPTEKRGRVHTSTVLVNVLIGTVEQTDFPDSDFDIRFYSGTGSGGQRRNKVQTCCTVTHRPTGLSQNANGRSRRDNEEDAMVALKERLRERQSGKQHDVLNDARKKQIGITDKAKRRTYHFQSDCVSDENGLTTQCSKFLKGHIDKLWR